MLTPFHLATGASGEEDEGMGKPVAPLLAFVLIVGCSVSVTPEPKVKGKTHAEWLVASRDLDFKTRLEAAAALLMLNDLSIVPPLWTSELFEIAEDSQQDVLVVARAKQRLSVVLKGMTIKEYRKEEARRFEAEHRMRIIMERAARRIIREPSLPNDADGKKIIEWHDDEWGKRLRFINLGTSFEIISNGPDGAENTADDLRLKVPLTK